MRKFRVQHPLETFKMLEEAEVGGQLPHHLPAPRIYDPLPVVQMKAPRVQKVAEVLKQSSKRVRVLL